MSIFEPIIQSIGVYIMIVYPGVRNRNTVKIHTFTSVGHSNIRLIVVVKVRI